MVALRLEISAAPPGPSLVRDELRSLARLGLPLALASLAQTLLSVVSSALVGRLGALELGAIGLGSSLHFAGAVLGMGVMLGLDPLFAQAAGAGDEQRARRALAQSFWLAFVLGIPLALASLLVGTRLEQMGIDATRAGFAREYLVVRAPSLVPYLWFIGLRSHAQAAGAERAVFASVSWALAAMMVTGPALVLGVPLLGLPGLGVLGAGLAETSCTLLQLVLLMVLVLPARRRTAARLLGAPSLAIWAQAARVGVPVGLQLLAEFGVFALVNVLVALVDAPALAAHHVAITLASTAFMVPVGLGAAAAVRVGRGVGQNDARAARLGGLVAMAIAFCFMLAVAASFLVFPRLLAGLLTTDEGVVDATVQLLLIAAAFQIADGLQAVAAGALRGAGDTQFTLFANLVGHYVLGAPLGVALALGAGLGARGLWWGLALGLAFVAIALAWRFVRVSGRPIAPV